MNTIKRKFFSIKPALALSALALLACNDNVNISPVSLSEDAAAVIAVRSAGYDSGAHSVLGLALPISAQNNLDASSSSDLGVVGGTGHFYRIAKFGSNQISRYSAAAPGTPVYTYSTDSVDGEQSNPYDLIEVSATKAYLLRYGSGKLWVVNPAAATEAQFKTGEIDLSQYDVDGVPEMATAVLSDGLLYVGLQRLENFSATQSSYLAVIDVASDMEVDTRPVDSAASLLGVDLDVRNVSQLKVVPSNGTVVALASGGFDSNFAPLYDGGIVTVEPSSNFKTTLVFNDAADHPDAAGRILDLAIDSAQRAYLTVSSGFDFDAGYERVSLYSVSPLTGDIGGATAVANFADIDLGDIALDALGRLWIGRTDSAAPGITVLDADNSVVEALVNTQLVPINIAFIQ